MKRIKQIPSYCQTSPFIAEQDFFDCISDEELHKQLMVFQEARKHCLKSFLSILELRMKATSLERMDKLDQLKNEHLAKELDYQNLAHSYLAEIERRRNLVSLQAALKKR